MRTWGRDSIEGTRGPGSPQHSLLCGLLCLGCTIGTIEGVNYRSTIGYTCAGMNHREGSVMREWPREWDPGCQVSGTGVGAGDAGTELSEIPQGISCKMGGVGVGLPGRQQGGEDGDESG